MKKWSIWQKIEFVFMVIIFTPILLIIGYAMAIVDVKNRTIKNLERRINVNGR